MDLEQLSALEALRRAKARYCRLVDSKDWDAFGRLFVPALHARFYNPDGTLAYAFDTLEAFLSTTASTLHGARTMHHAHNPDITLQPEGNAEAIWSMEDRIVYDDGVPGPFRSLHGMGYYHEQWIRQQGEWRIRSLVLRRTILTVQ